MRVAAAGPQAVLQLWIVFPCARGFELHSTMSLKQQLRRGRVSAAIVIHAVTFFVLQ